MDFEMTKFRAIISGGGTGGHVFPAIAIANALKKRNEDIQILFVGAMGKLEMEKVPAAGYEIVGLNIQGFQRKLTFKNFAVIGRLVRSMFKARKIVKDFKPDIAIGVGGYASGPVLAACSMMGIPTVIQEQNSYAGVTNKILGKKAKKVCTAYDNMEQFFAAGKIVMTGNPVRDAIVHMDGGKEEALKHFKLEQGRKTILVVGGSLGAKTINLSIEAGLPNLEKAGVQVIWQTGKYFIERAKEAVATYDNVKALKFIDRMDLAYTAADMIISRAGALSISELSLVKKPVILIPSPNVSEDHQTHNAMALVNKDAAIMVKDKDAKKILIKTALELIENPEKQQELQQNIEKMGIPDAADKIAAEVEKLVES